MSANFILHIFAGLISIKIMATITLEYDVADTQAQKTLGYILSLGLFKPNLADKMETLSEKRQRLNRELKGYLVDLSGFKFNREEANVYE